MATHGHGNNHDTPAFVRISNKDVWLKLIELERRVDSLTTKLYAFASAVVIISVFLSLTGGIHIGT